MKVIEDDDTSLDFASKTRWPLVMPLPTIKMQLFFREILVLESHSKICGPRTT
jgi:hypothetical protein